MTGLNDFNSIGVPLALTKKTLSGKSARLGEEAVLDSTNATEDDRKVYDTVIGKFDSIFKFVKMSYTREPYSIVEVSCKGNQQNST